MVAIKAHEAARALQRLDPRIALLLFYGPDTGLVSERAKAAATGAVADPDDPFLLVKLEGDIVAADPARLADEASTIGMFGGRRAIWLRPSSKNLAPAVEAALASQTGDSLIVVEAGDLNKSAPLRMLCERSPKALAVPCYPDDGKALGAVIDDDFRAAGIAVSREARAVLLESLGGDRLATRSEIEKVLLFAYGKNELSADDLEEILSDVSALRTDNLVDAAFSGDGARADAAYQRLLREGTHPSVILGAILRHALALLPLSIDVESGRAASSVVESWRGLNFKRKPAVQAHLGAFTPAILRGLIEKLQDAILQTRRLADLAEPITARVILDISRRARASKR